MKIKPRCHLVNGFRNMVVSLFVNFGGGFTFYVKFGFTFNIIGQSGNLLAIDFFNVNVNYITK